MKITSEAEATPPHRTTVADELGKPHVRSSPRRFRWRAVIRSGAKLDPSAGHPSVAWHLAECRAPADLEAHCETGRRLIDIDGNPDGHCLLEGECPRCTEARELAEAAEAAAAAASAAEAAASEASAASHASADPPVAEPPEPDAEAEEPRPTTA